MITVACVKWGDKYGGDYVTTLQSMCRRHLAAHRFVCFTERDVAGVTCAPLPSDLPTWWSKVGLFKPGLFTGDVLFLDLDVVITDDIQPMVGLLEGDRSGLWIRDDFSYSLRVPKHGIGSATMRQLGGPGCCNSSVMMWHADTCRDVWDYFDPKVMDVLHGDQNWITKILYPDKIRFLPDRWAGSYRYGGSGVIKVFHGRTKPHMVPDDEWVKQCWR